MLSCKALVACSSDYLDDQLPFSERLSVRAHLAMCGKCRRFVRQLRLTLRVLQQMPDPQVHDVDAVAKQLADAAKKPT